MREGMFLYMKEVIFDSKTLDDIKIVMSRESLKSIIDSLPIISILINEKRNIIYSNLQKLGYEFEDLNIRPGNVVKCVNTKDYVCGTSPSCEFCNLNRAISKTLKTNLEVSTKCAITSKESDFLESHYFKVVSTPLSIDDNHFILCSFIDLTKSERQKLMEKIFFHDIINVAGGIDSFLKLIDNSTDIEELKTLIKHITDLSSHLIDIIISQKEIIDAENDNLKLDISPLSSLDLLLCTMDNFSNHSDFQDKEVVLYDDYQNIHFESDHILIQRVLTNMVKNALEASKPNSKVFIGSFATDNSILFKVHNDSYIPQNIRENIFNHSFSTKGVSRGFGTYSMKLLGEKFLNGKVYFKSNEDNGTDFFLELPF